VKLVYESLENMANFGYWERAVSFSVLWTKKLRAI
jgi:hypothetical protein